MTLNFSAYDGSRGAATEQDYTSYASENKTDKKYDGSGAAKSGSALGKLPEVPTGEASVVEE